MASDRRGYYSWRGADLLLHCQLQPQASRDEFVGVTSSDAYGERLKVRVQAPPVDGKANDRLVAFLAGQFGVARRAVHIESGASARQKTVRIEQPGTLPPALSIARPASTL
jgi:uncharacterized protein (TIGR00251 family)